jgi:hypothetical protein
MMRRFVIEKYQHILFCSFVGFLGLCSLAFAADNKAVPALNDPFHSGNYALSTSQQPGPLVGFGQTQLYLLADDYIGIRKHAIDVAPGLIYGFTDNLAVFFTVPYAASYQQDGHHAAGLEDALVQLEYAFYNHQGQNFMDQATLVTSFSWQTGNVTRNPPTGYGSPTLFLGATFNRMYPDWFAYTAHGIGLTTTKDATQIGNYALYQFGLGRNLFSIDSKWIVALQAELDGDYEKRNVIQGVTDPDSGGNVVYLTPSLFVSSKNLIMQLGAGMAVSQNLYGDQTRNTYLLISNIGWTF